MKQHIYIKTWNGFSPSTSVKKNKLSDHYEKFYNEGNNEFSDNKQWLDSKLSVAEDLVEILKPYKKILSLGCGRGVIEKSIIKKLDKDSSIHGIDPYIDVSSEFELGNLKIQKASVFDYQLPEYDIAYLNTVDYCLDDLEYSKICTRLFQLTKNGIIISQLMPPNINYLFSLKYRIGSFIKSLPISPYVFWGWHRSIDEHMNLLNNCGYTRFTFGYHKNNLIWLHAT